MAFEFIACVVAEDLDIYMLTVVMKVIAFFLGKNGKKKNSLGEEKPLKKVLKAKVECDL